MNEQQVLLKTFEFGLYELIQQRLKLMHFPSTEVKIYTEILIFYFESDPNKLEKLFKNDIVSNSMPLSILIKLRYHIRKNDLDSEQILQLCTDEITEQIPHFWLGEIYFCKAMLLSFSNHTDLSRDFYAKAKIAFDELGCYKKSLKSFLNYIVACTKIDPLKNYIPEYRALALSAQKSKDTVIESMAYLNISQEYEIIQAYDAALYEARLAYQLAISDIESLHLYYIRLQLSHILWLKNQKIESMIFLEQCKNVQHFEIKCAIQTLEYFFGLTKDLSSSVIDQLTPPWKEKVQRFNKYKLSNSFLYSKTNTKLNLNDGTHFNQMTQNETKLIDLLLTGPKTKDELVNLMYGDKLSYESAENRLRVLISRIRKKNKKLIESSHGIYRISNLARIELKQA
ncbi:MAG: helix-turn-helix domain-containing protein [Pseudobdellovibrio sp.]